MPPFTNQKSKAIKQNKTKQKKHTQPPSLISYNMPRLNPPSLFLLAKHIK